MKCCFLAKTSREPLWSWKGIKLLIIIFVVISKCPASRSKQQEELGAKSSPVRAMLSHSHSHSNSHVIWSATSGPVPRVQYCSQSCPSCNSPWHRRQSGAGLTFPPACYHGSFQVVHFKTPPVRMCPLECRLAIGLCGELCLLRPRGDGDTATGRCYSGK